MHKKQTKQLRAPGKHQKPLIRSLCHGGTWPTRAQATRSEYNSKTEHASMCAVCNQASYGEDKAAGFLRAMTVELMPFALASACASSHT